MFCYVILENLVSNPRTGGRERNHIEESGFRPSVSWVAVMSNMLGLWENDFRVKEKSIYLMELLDNSDASVFRMLRMKSLTLDLWVVPLPRSLSALRELSLGLSSSLPSSLRISWLLLF